MVTTLLAITVAAQAEPPAPNRLRIKAASSAYDTGIITVLTDAFHARRPEVDIEVVPGGALGVLDDARAGQADLVITHNAEAEAAFVEQGYGVNRTLIMYDEFAIFGPPNDPLHLAREPDINRVLQHLARAKAEFLVPAPQSGTYRRTAELWQAAGVTTDWVGYESTNSSAAATLIQAGQFGAYTLADLGTYFTLRDQLRGQIAPLYRDHPSLRNAYSALVVNRARVADANQTLAQQFLEFLISDPAQALIAGHGDRKYGTHLYTAAAHLDPALVARRAARELERKTFIINLLVLFVAALSVLSAVAVWFALRARRAEQARHQSETRFALATSGTSDAIWDWDIKTGETWYSPRWKEIIGFGENNGDIGNTLDEWKRRLHPDDRELVLAMLDNYLEGRSQFFSSEHRLRNRRGDYIWVLNRAKILWDSHGQPLRVTGSVTDITERKLQSITMEHQALHDILTDLPNRSLFVDRLHQALAAAQRDNQPLAVVVININQFRDVNDALGHQGGDHVLQQVALRLRAIVRRADTLSRLGGDEFAILMPSANLEQAILPVHRILRSLDQPITERGQGFPLRAAIGITLFPDHAEDADSMLQRAYVSMYTAKRAGTDYVVYGLSDSEQRAPVRG